MKALVLVAVLVPSLAAADDVCVDEINDPIVTSVRDVYLDAQRGACLRDELAAGIGGHALIDTPGFHGVLGGDLALVGRKRFAERYELSAQLRVVDFAFVQNAVNKVTNAGFGPLVIGAAANGSLGAGARAALVARLELPYTRDEMDTQRVSGELAGVTTGRLSAHLLLHARLGLVGMHAASTGGDTQRLALRAGSDVAWQLRERSALHAGLEAMAGWRRGFDHVLVRAGFTRRIGEVWRLRTGLGIPLGGSERTNALVDIALVHEL